MSTTSMDPKVYRAAKLGEITHLQEVVKEDSSRLLRVTPNKNTALHISVRFGHIEFVKEVYSALLQHNTSLEGNTEYSRSLSLLTQVNSEGDTALHAAARKGHASIAKFLIEKIKPWTSDHDVESGSSSSVVPEQIRMRNKSFHTALHEAVRGNDLEMVKLLTEADPDLRHPNYEVDAYGHGESPLYLAARDGCLDILNHIFLICPSPTHGGPHGQTALHVATVDNRLDVVKLLLEKMGEVLVNKADEDGRTALHYAVSSRSHVLETIKLLLRHDTSSAYTLDKDGLSPLHIAALRSSIEVLRELIEYCPDSAEWLDQKRRNVLHFAVMSKDFKKISFALEQQELEELVNKPDDDGNTPFHLAATLGSFKLIQHFLSKRKVDVKATNNEGQTATEIFLSIPTQDTIFSLIRRTFFARIWLPRNALRVRGEKKWMIGVGEKRMQIRSNHNKQEEKEQLGSDQNKTEIVVAATTTKMTESQKEAAQILQIVASLITTVAFTAVFQVPGGYNSNNGKPILQHNEHFQKFVIFDIAALNLSVTSLMVMFIGPRFGGGLLYSSSLNMCTFIVCSAILFIAVAFREGLKAVLPHCGGSAEYICYVTFYGVSTQTFADFGTLTFSCFVQFAVVARFAYLILTQDSVQIKTSRSI